MKLLFSEVLCQVEQRNLSSKVVISPANSRTSKEASSCCCGVPGTVEEKSAHNGHHPPSYGCNLWSYLMSLYIPRGGSAHWAPERSARYTTTAPCEGPPGIRPWRSTPLGQSASSLTRKDGRL